MCFLHTNELPLKHVFANLNGSTNSPDTFLGPIVKKLHGSVSNILVTNFKHLSVPLSSFPTLPPHAVNVLITDRCFAYERCWAVIHGKVDDDVMYLEVGLIVHLKWLSLRAEYYVILCL